MDHAPELRQDAVSGEWILVASGRRRRPDQFVKTAKQPLVSKKDCPFEDPQAAGNGGPLGWYSSLGREDGVLDQKKWKIQVIPNKFPAVISHKGICPSPHPNGIYRRMEGIGFHEVIITRDHTKLLSAMKPEEAEIVTRAYQDRILAHVDEECLEYILVFQNHGAAAGASVVHPHSQVIALPIIPPDVQRSLEGAERYWLKYRKCVHCEIIKWEEKERDRVVYKNKEFMVIAPYASHVSFEVRIFPRTHASRFEEISNSTRLHFADALVTTLRKLKTTLKDPAFNFFIHTSPVAKGKYSYYHWHLEILPKTAHLGGVELGTGIEVVTMRPEEAALYLRKAK